MRARKTNMQDTPCEMTVALATPATSQCRQITKYMFNTTLMTPAIAKKINGLFVSPNARRMELPKLYNNRKGMPMK